MSYSPICILIILLMYLVIIVMIPFFLDYLFSVTVRRKRKDKVLALAKARSKATNKPIILYNNRYNGVVIEPDGIVSSGFESDLVEASKQLADNSCVLVVSEALEYVDTDSLSELVDRLRDVSGGDLYTINIEANSPRTLWDYKIINLAAEPFYLPQASMTWSTPNKLQCSIQKFYEKVFKVVPYDLVAYDPVVKVKN